MDFAFSEEQEEFRAMVRRFVEERWPVAESRRLAETDAGFDRAVWKQMASELGLQGLALPEAYGGQGFGFLELGIALEELGRQLAGGPFVASACLAAPAILAAASGAQRAALLPAIAAGDEIAALAVLEPDGRAAPGGITATCRKEAAGYRVSGAKAAVIDGQNADLLVVAAREAGSAGTEGISLLAVRADAPGLEVRALPGLDLTRKLADVVLRDAPAEPLGAPGAGWPALARTLDLAAIALAAEGTGSAARCLESAVAYAKTRVQFARPIGSFQAIKHRVAEAMLELESARSAAYWSWWVAAQEGSDTAALAEAASVAKAVCSDAFLRSAADNLHIHGGVGFTWEFDCHLYYRRAQSSSQLFGDAVAHRERIAAGLGL